MRALVKCTLERSVPKKVLERIGPKHSISSLYGIVKLHRENQPLRPIQTPYDSLASNIEKFFVKLLEPLKQQLIYTVDSEKAFKEKLMSEKHKFRPVTHEIVCFDVTKLFPSVNVKRVIGCIMKHYSVSPELFFNFQNFEGEKLPPPPKAKFREFLEGVLLKFNVFECLMESIAKNGLPMGVHKPTFS